MGKQAAEIGERLRRQLELVCKDIVLTLDKKLRNATPIDTGHARRNWVPSVGQAFASETTGDDAHAAGIAQILAYRLEQGVLWEANNVPYIRRLNYGYSRQRAAGWIERAIDETLAEAQQRWLKRGIDLTAIRTAHQSNIGGQGAGNLASAYSPFGDDE
jgi:hypothetical protein